MDHNAHFHINIPRFCSWKFAHFHAMNQQAKSSQCLVTSELQQLTSSFFMCKRWKLEMLHRQEKYYAFADLKLWIPMPLMIRIFNMKNRSRMMNEHYWPCTLTINLVSCIMQRNLTIQKSPTPHLWYNPITPKALREQGVALWLNSDEIIHAFILQGALTISYPKHLLCVEHTVSIQWKVWCC